MKIKQVFNIGITSIQQKEHNIFVPICLGNKFFLDGVTITKNVAEYMRWALENASEKVLVLVVDKIQDTNYFVREKGNRSLTGSRKKVLRDGEEIKKQVEKLIKKEFSNFQEKITCISYQEYQNHDQYTHEVTTELYKEFKNNPYFSKAILHTVKTTITDRTFTDEEYLQLCDYILDEFSLCCTGLEYEGIYYGLYVYPQTDSTVHLIENIQTGSLFPDLSRRLPKRQVGLAILNNDEHCSAGDFYNGIAENYEEIINGPEVKQELHNKLIEIMKKHGIERGTILDVGCGPGNLKKTIQKEIGRKFSYTGIDISAKMLNLAKGRKYETIHGNIEEIVPLLQDKSYDYVIALSSLQFVPNIQTILGHFERIARKGYIVSVDNMTDEYKKGFSAVCNTQLYNHFDIVIPNTMEDISFLGWVSPREKKPIRVRMVFHKETLTNNI